jgi:hypothetical protein
MKRPAIIYGMTDRDKTRRLAVLVAVTIAAGLTVPEAIGRAIF